ncbi:PIN domain-containing protein [Mycobacterium canetti]|uniref:PIN domain-containing protein n=1 Tax=Mycobacterium canetti TaxID=78331 RepID=UPI0002A58694|nr:PIN domain-containing protein [Mycobacterium canetti]CCK63180.1 Conserved protein of unknown function [Mycobacterium canettii CIPT 140070017]
MFAALLDTSVLWPSLQRDFLLSMAAEGLYRPLWSTAILDELSYHEAQKLVRRGHDPAVAAQRVRGLVDRMSMAFDDAVVANWESLEGTFGFPDVGDEHVVAAALVGGADVIVTSNVKNFPPLRPAAAESIWRERFRCGSGCGGGSNTDAARRSPQRRGAWLQPTSSGRRVPVLGLGRLCLR